ncbi:MAG TPA: zinc-ribbon domain-containing protein [Candidatus Onthovivens sp.]|nr:zinc-ribbon domain-containing protein [Candidatus Onthovivens sp.]
MYCRNCGTEVDSKVVYCPRCGSKLYIRDLVNVIANNEEEIVNSKAKVAILIFCIAIPFLGYIYYFANRKYSNPFALLCLKGAMANTIFFLLLYTVTMIIITFVNQTLFWDIYRIIF